MTKNLFRSDVHSRAGLSKKKTQNCIVHRECNLCRKSFAARSRLIRFCRSCRLESELYRMAEWLPMAEVSLG